MLRQSMSQKLTIRRREHHDQKEQQQKVKLSSIVEWIKTAKHEDIGLFVQEDGENTLLTETIVINSVLAHWGGVTTDSAACFYGGKKT